MSSLKAFPLFVSTTVRMPPGLVTDVGVRYPTSQR